jgi:hypothetical protein
MNESHRRRFCTLEYRPQESSSGSTQAGSIILLVYEEGEGSLRFLIHPELRAVVRENDLPYIQSLLLDFQERAKLNPEALFKQLSSLGVGPLVTHEVGTSISEHPNLLEMCSNFMQI